LIGEREMKKEGRGGKRKKKKGGGKKRGKNRLQPNPSTRFLGPRHQGEKACSRGKKKKREKKKMQSEGREKRRRDCVPPQFTSPGPPRRGGKIVKK